MSGKNFIEGMYDMAKVDPSKELTKSDERRMKLALESNQTLFKQNKDIFAQNEKRFHICPQYQPCPVCHKCKAKASHLYVKCQTCTIPICRHTYGDAKKLIKREPFTIRATEEMAQMILEIEKDAKESECCERERSIND